jgi:hypothetical protein
MICLEAEGEWKAYFGSRCKHRFFSKGRGEWLNLRIVYGLCLILKKKKKKSCRKLPVT